MPYMLRGQEVTTYANWSKIGFTPTMTTADSDVWSAAGAYVFPIAAAGLEMLSSDNAQDIGTVIKGDATGNTVQSDAGGTTTTLVDADVNFGAATAVAVGDCVLLDPHGATPEYGWVTAVATNTLTVAGGFSKGGTGASRYYAVVDYSANSGAKVVKIEYLDGSYATKTELCVLTGTTVVPTVNTDIFRINAFRVIFTGSGLKPVGNISLRNLADTPVYSYITAGYTRARNSIYTVPAGKTLYINSVALGYGYAVNQTHYCRLQLRMASNESFRTFVPAATGLPTLPIFYPVFEFVSQSGAIAVPTMEEIKVLEKTDIKVSGIATAAGIATSMLRGHLE